MAEIRGKYVYDDDFTPGRKGDGGLSQNLYNDEGRVETHATFIPDDEYEYEPDSEPQGLSDEDRRRAEELGALLGAALVAIAIRSSSVCEAMVAGYGVARTQEARCPKAEGRTCPRRVCGARAYRAVEG